MQLPMDTGKSVVVVSAVTAGRFLDSSASYVVTSSFHVFSNLLLTYLPLVPHHIDSDIDGIK